MRILMVFIDMLRPNLMYICNEHAEESVLDRELTKIGGTLFLNCFSPAPDSGRSLGCLWSGLYSSKNQCDKRIKYPKFYLDSSCENLLELLYKNGYSFNFYINHNERKLGVLPNGFDEIGNHNVNLNLDEYTKNISIKENSLTYISLTDFHWAQDDIGYNELATKYGYERVASSLRILQKNLDFNNFDCVFILSDHGFKLQSELAKEDKHKILNRDRANIFMQVKLRDHVGLTLNSKLCSIMDVYPTICELININATVKFDGISLLNQKEYHSIIAEDHLVFAPQINQNIEIWAVIKKNGIFYRTLDNYYYDNKEEFNESVELLDDIISEYSKNYGEYRKEHYILGLYKTMNVDKSFYNDGTKRIEYNGKSNDNLNGYFRKIKNCLLKFYRNR